MRHRQWRVFLAAGVFVAGAATLFRSIRPWTATRNNNPRPVALADAQRLAEAEPRAVDDADAVATEIERHVSDAALESANPFTLSAEQSRSLGRVVGERVRSLLSPDYERHVQSLSARAAARVDLARDKPIWNAMAQQFADAPIDPAGVRVVLRWLNGLELSRPGGHVTSNTAPGNYGDLTDPEAQRFTVIDIYLPMSLNDPVHGRPLRLYYIVSMAWDERTYRWQPWRMSVYDPENRDAVLPAPWM